MESIKFLSDSIVDLECAFVALEQAVLFEEFELLRKSCLFICPRFEEVTVLDNFYNLTAAALSVVVANDYLLVNQELDVVYAILHW